MQKGEEGEPQILRQAQDEKRKRSKREGVDFNAEKGFEGRKGMDRAGKRS